MRRIAVLLLVTLPLVAQAQTDVSGSQSGTWAAAGSPYRVVGQIVVPSGQTLTIEPGVTVDFQGHYKLTVEGMLSAVGTAADSIFFTTGNPAVGWGGIRISSGDISELAYCRIEYGKTVGGYPDCHGGGLALFGSDAVVTNTVFADNDATGDDLGMGGAVYASGTGSAAGPLTRFVDCVFLRNHCYGEGGAVKFTGDLNTEITGCEFYENDSGYGGGAISCYLVEGTTMTNCVFADNYTMFGAGGVLNTLGSWNTVFFINCTLTGNAAVVGDGGAVNIAYGEGTFVNTIIYDNNGMYSDDLHLDMLGFAEVHYCNMIVPVDATASNNIYVLPQFADPANHDFSLLETSLCIDEGVAYFEIGGDVLVDLAPGEYGGTAPDIGAYEHFPETAAPVETTLVSGLARSYPNPFSARTAVCFRLAGIGHVNVQVFNARGQVVTTLIDGVRDAGEHAVVWNGRDDDGRRVGAGTYFLRMEAGGVVSTSRVVMSF